MLYLIAALLPPLAVLMSGKPFQALLNAALLILGVVCILSVFAAPVGFWLIGAVSLHGILVAHNFYADERQRRLEAAFTGVAAKAPPKTISRAAFLHLPEQSVAPIEGDAP